MLPLVLTVGAIEKTVQNILSELDLPQSASDHYRMLAVLGFLPQTVDCAPLVFAAAGVEPSFEGSYGVVRWASRPFRRSAAAAGTAPAASQNGATRLEARRQVSLRPPIRAT